MVAEDGIYQLDNQQLTGAGIPVDQIPGNQYQLFHNGEEVPVYTTTDGIFGISDRIEFYGQKNQSELDRHLFQNPDEEMMNPLYSLFTDTSAYFLTWTDIGSPLRFEEVQNDLTDLPEKEEYYMEELVGEYHTNWAQEGYNYVYSSTFNRAEGFSSSLKNVQEFILEPTSVYAGGPQANLHIRYSGNAKPHKQEISLNGSLLTTDEFSNFEVRQLNLGIESAQLNSSVTINFQGITDNVDKQRVSNLVLTYPRLFNADNNNTFTFRVGTSNVKRYIEITDFDSGTNAPILFDLTNNSRMEALVENGLVEMTVYTGIESHKMILAASTAFKSPASIQPVSFTDYSGIDANYLILSNKRLFDDGQGINQVQLYSDYRSSIVGGNYKPLIVEVQQLYDQFGWGLNRHSLALRNFGLFVKPYLPDPSYLFILGKGREYPGTRTNSQLAHANNATYYVPSFGTPGSDNLLMSEKGAVAPFFSIGRLPVENPGEIAIYLKKIKEHEGLTNLPSTIEDRLWMKRVLHLGGGGNASEQSIIRNNLDGMKSSIEISEYGADVHSFFKSSSDPVQISTNDAIFNLINGGLSVITFFGHSGVNTFDFNIDNPVNYENKGRYPLMFSLGCYIGGIHTTTKGVSERFVLFKDGAAIGFVASTGAGFISSLNSYTRQVYSMMGNDLYGKPIGDILRGTNEYLESSSFGDRILVQQVTLNGDPALRLNNFEGPDYVADFSSVKITPSIVNVTTDNFKLEFDLINIGKATVQNDSIDLVINQELPDNSIVELKKDRVAVPLNRISLSYDLPTLGEASLGLNKLHIELDKEGVLVEMPAPVAEANNELTDFSGQKGFTFFIQNNGVKAVYPYEFAIVGYQDLTLTASTYDPLVSTQKYIFQMDTIETFDSPYLMQYEIEQAGGLLKWQPNINLQEEEVYYWRVSPDSVSAVAGFNWSASSFVYLEGKEGWNQSDFGQYLDNEYEGLKLVEEDRDISFVANLHDVRVKNKVYESGDPPQFVVSGQPIGCPWPWLVDQGIQMILINPVWYPNWFTPPIGGAHGSVPANNVICPWIYETNDSEDRENLINFIENIVPDNWYVIFYSVQKNIDADYSPEEWAVDSLLFGKNLFSVLEERGATKIRKLEEKGAVPYVFIFQEGGGALAESIANDINDEPIVEQAFPEFVTEGGAASTLIGPAKRWDEFNWDELSVIGTENDTIMLSVYGINLDQNVDSLLVEGIQEKIFDLDDIDAQQFPYLKLSFTINDETDRTARNLENWRVVYDGVPELAVSPSSLYEFHKDTLQQGEIFSVEYALENISDNDADSVLIKYNVFNQQNQGDEIYNRIEELKANQVTNAILSFDSKSLSGLQSINVEVNPNDDQPELSHLNNFLIDQFFVEKDNKNPLLEITFDGQHLMDGDLVAPEPLIIISLKDENPFLGLNDTSNINLFIKTPTDQLADIIPLDGDETIFFPAIANGKNEARVEYRPDFKLDGIYELLVQGTDVTGNVSGKFDYKVSFEISNKDAISNLINYPNPFSTSTRFIYTLTGRETPTDYKLQIMTVSGRIVKEIDEMELGPLRVGTNMTDFAWDGRDEYGDRLANGVYLYRFSINEKTGTEREKYQQEKIDKYFKGGVGKMVLIR